MTHELLEEELTCVHYSYQRFVLSETCDLKVLRMRIIQNID